MKNRKKIVIKSERLNQVRNNFRKIIVVAVQSQVKELANQIESTGKFRELNSSEKREVHDLRAKKSKLESDLKDSVCKCLQCGRMEGDMKYNLASKEWHCPDCWEDAKLVYERDKALRDSGKPVDDYALDYYGSFTD